MTDLSSTIKPKSDQLNADDLIAGPLTVTITDVTSRAGDQPIAINFIGDNGKPYLPCKSMRRVLVMLWGNDGKSYVGRSMTLYNDTEVTWGGAKVGGIRISHMSDIDGDKTLALTANKSQRKPYVVKKLNDVRVKLKQDGDAAAQKGEAALLAWFTALSKEHKVLAKQEFMEELKAKAKAVETQEDEDLLK